MKPKRTIKPKLPIEANISEIGGPYYQVKLAAVPRVGELIELYSFLDAKAKSPDGPMKRYRVVEVLHHVRDVAEEIWQSKDGCHHVTVIVKPAHSKFFNPVPLAPSASPGQQN
jgi:hypothetical protein